MPNIGLTFTEVDTASTYAITPAELNNVGVIQRSRRGLPNKAVRLTSYSDYTRRYGAARPTATYPELTQFAMRALFRNCSEYGAVVWVTRVVATDSETASLPCIGSSMILSSLAAGTSEPYNNEIQVKVEAATSGTTGYKKITISKSGVTEIFDEVNIGNVVSAINVGATGINGGAKSAIVQVTAIGNVMPDNIGFTNLSGGSSSVRSSITLHPASLGSVVVNEAFSSGDVTNLVFDGATLFDGTTNPLPDAGVIQIEDADVDTNGTGGTEVQFGHSSGSGRDFKFIAQQITNVKGNNISKLVINKSASTVTSAANDIIVEIRTDDGSNSPSAVVLARRRIAKADWADASGNITVPIKCSVTNGSKYWVVFWLIATAQTTETYANAAGETTNAGALAASTTSTYANGLLKAGTNGTTFGTTIDADLDIVAYFVEYIRYNDSYIDYGTDAGGLGPSAVSVVTGNRLHRGAYSTRAEAFSDGGANASSKVFPSPVAIQAGQDSYADPGEWANSYYVEVTAATGAPDQRNVYVYYNNSGSLQVVESWLNLTASNFASTINNDGDGSKYIRVNQSSGYLPDPFSAAPLLGGLDGTAGTLYTEMQGDESLGTGIYALNAATIQMVTAPDWCTKEAASVLDTYALSRGINAIAAVSYNGGSVVSLGTTWTPLLMKQRSNLSVYRGWQKMDDGLGGTVWCPPNGHVIGAGWIRKMLSKGGYPHIAPAGNETGFRDTLGTEYYTLSPGDRNYLVQNDGINPIEYVPGAGVVIMTSRTMSSLQKNYSAHVRRTVNWHLETMRNNLGWISQTTNDADTRTSLSDTLKAFFKENYSHGMYERSQGIERAFSVVCDSTNNPPSVTRLRRLICEMKVAIVECVESAEFLLSHRAGEPLEISEI